MQFQFLRIGQWFVEQTNTPFPQVIFQKTDRTTARTAFGIEQEFAAETKIIVLDIAGLKEMLP